MIPRWSYNPFGWSERPLASHPQSCSAIPESASASSPTKVARTTYLRSLATEESWSASQWCNDKGKLWRKKGCSSNCQQCWSMAVVSSPRTIITIVRNPYPNIGSLLLTLVSVSRYYSWPTDVESTVRCILLLNIYIEKYLFVNIQTCLGKLGYQAGFWWYFYTLFLFQT